MKDVRFITPDNDATGLVALHNPSGRIDGFGLRVVARNHRSGRFMKHNIAVLAYTRFAGDRQISIEVY